MEKDEVAFKKEEAGREVCSWCQDGKDLHSHCVFASGMHVGRDEGHPDTGADQHAESDMLCFIEDVRQLAGGEGHQQADQAQQT